MVDVYVIQNDLDEIVANPINSWLVYVLIS